MHYLQAFALYEDREAQDRIFRISYQAGDGQTGRSGFHRPLENPNPVGINGISADYELYIDDSRFAVGKSADVDLPPDREIALTVPVVVVYKELLNAIGPAIERFLSNQKSMPITVEVKVYGNPRLYSNTEEAALPPFEKRITRTIDIPLPQDEINKARGALEKAIRRLF